jgi:hypothetical protein
MRAHDHGGSLVVIRSEAESGQFGLRLIGELDLNTIEVLDAQLGDTREQAPPSVIDISELRFLDLTGLRALRRAGHGDGSFDARSLPPRCAGAARECGTLPQVQRERQSADARLRLGRRDGLLVVHRLAAVT